MFVLTDGEVSNADLVIKLVKENSSHTRVFSLGLGSSASRHLVNGIARWWISLQCDFCTNYWLACKLQYLWSISLVLLKWTILSLFFLFLPFVCCQQQINVCTKIADGWIWTWILLCQQLVYQLYHTTTAHCFAITLMSRLVLTEPYRCIDFKKTFRWSLIRVIIYTKNI